MIERGRGVPSSMPSRWLIEPATMLRHDDLQRDDLDLADQLLTQVQPLDEVVGHADAVQARHDELADAVVDDALAVELGLLLAR
jgi:hypothetical protein